MFLAAEAKFLSSSCVMWFFSLMAEMGGQPPTTGVCCWCVGLRLLAGHVGHTGP